MASFSTSLHSPSSIIHPLISSTYPLHLPQVVAHQTGHLNAPLTLPTLSLPGLKSPSFSHLGPTKAAMVTGLQLLHWSPTVHLSSIHWSPSIKFPHCCFFTNSLKIWLNISGQWLRLHASCRGMVQPLDGN